jgi:hypothetical protein
MALEVDQLHKTSTTSFNAASERPYVVVQHCVVLQGGPTRKGTAAPRDLAFIRFLSGVGSLMTRNILRGHPLTTEPALRLSTLPPEPLRRPLLGRLWRRRDIAGPR